MNDLVSVIVPVYNVAQYLDMCLQSISNQTYENIEVLLIVGKSNDDSAEICKEWCGKDCRFRYIREAISGLGNARNQGVQEAAGEYLVFIDSDDYVLDTYIEKLYTAIKNNNADIAECDFYRNKGDESNMAYSNSTKVMGRVLSKEEKLIIGAVTTWKIMAKKSFWKENNLYQMNLGAEDYISYPFIIYSAKKIAYVNEGLYVYRMNATISLSKSLIVRKNLYKSMEVMLEKIKREDWYDEKKDTIKNYVLRHISRWLSPIVSSVDENAYMKIRDLYMGTYYKNTGENELDNHINIGGFNLGRILIKLNMLEDPYRRYQFSSIISIMNNNTDLIDINNKNFYRNMMIQRDTGNHFIDTLNEKGLFDYLFIDLIEERFDIIETGNSYYTKSNAFDEAEICGEYEYRVIPRDSDECRILWEKSFDELIKYTKYRIKKKIIVIENYLCEKHSDGVEEEEFENVIEIRKKNSILKTYYDYIRECYPNILIIDAYNDEQYVTDNQYEYGCYPFHLNEWANIRIAEKIQSQMDKYE